MIESSIEELFNSINDSSEYKEYKKIVEILAKNKDIMKMVEEIKALQKEATNLEYLGDDRYKDIDKEIEEKIQILNSNKDYQEYLEKLKSFNKVLLASSSMIEEYVDEKVGM